MATENYKDRYEVVADTGKRESYFVRDNEKGAMYGPFGLDAFDRAEQLNEIEVVKDL